MDKVAAAESKNVIRHEQEKKFEEVLWLCGTKVGKITGSFIMVNLPFLT